MKAKEAFKGFIDGSERLADRRGVECGIDRLIIAYGRIMAELTDETIDDEAYEIAEDHRRRYKKDLTDLMTADTTYMARRRERFEIYIDAAERAKDFFGRRAERERGSASYR